MDVLDYVPNSLNTEHPVNEAGTAGVQNSVYSKLIIHILKPYSVTVPFPDAKIASSHCQFKKASYVN